MLKMKWRHKITNDEVFQKGERRKITFKILTNRRHSRIVHIIRHNEFVINIIKGAV
jgi:hypothetical protein